MPLLVPQTHLYWTGKLVRPFAKTIPSVPHQTNDYRKATQATYTSNLVPKYLGRTGSIKQASQNWRVWLPYALKPTQFKMWMSPHSWHHWPLIPWRYHLQFAVIEETEQSGLKNIWGSKPLLKAALNSKLIGCSQVKALHTYSQLYRYF